MNAFLGELRRRNVLRVGAAYAVAAWLVLQVADLVFDAIGAPAWAMKALLVCCALGLPFALTFAWVFELTPQGLQRESEIVHSPAVALDTRRKLNYVIITALSLAVGMLLYDKFVRSDYVADEGSATAMPITGARSIAVLPFVNMSDDPGNEYFSDGLSEELLNLLAKVDGLKVAARTSSFKFKGAKADIEEIGGALGVATVLEGSVRRSGNQVRITAQLINAKDGFHIWSETYDRSLDNIFHVQDEIAGAIVEALKLPLLGPKSAPAAAKATKTLAAYDLYLLGRHLSRESTNASLKQALGYFQRAIEADPGYAPAYSGLAYAYGGLANYGDMPAAEATAAAGRAADKALALDPALGEAWAAKGSVLASTGRLDESLMAMRKAVALNPNLATAWLGIANSQAVMGHAQEAITASARAAELDPMSDLVRQQHMVYMSEGGRPADARNLGLEWVAAEPQNAFAHEGLAEAYRLLGQPQRAAVAYARANDLRPGDTYMARRVSEAFLTMDDLPSAKRWLDESRKRGPMTFNTLVGEFDLAAVEGDEKKQAALVKAVLDQDPNSRLGLTALGVEQLRTGQLVAAEATMQRVLALRGDKPDQSLMPPSVPPALGLALIYKQRGDAERLAFWLARLSTLRDKLEREVPASSDGPLLAARIASLRGDRDLMLSELRNAARQNFRLHWQLETGPVFAPWRDDVQFKAFVAELKLQNIALHAELVKTKEGQALVAPR